MARGDWAERFDVAFATPPSLVQRRVWRAVFGDRFPEDLDPYSFVTSDELERFVDELRVAAGDLLLDVGCGRGGPGVWVAQKTGARLVGIDIAGTALAAARRRAEQLSLDAEFRFGSFEQTGLDDAAADAVMSVDALLFTADKSAAARELARVLRPGGRLVLTTWDYREQPANRPPQVGDHRPALAAAGFDVLAYEETTDWRTLMEETTAGLLDAVDELAAEAGRSRDEIEAELHEMADTFPAISRRVLVVAERG
jgi:SAM-dependent methyltransferase